MKTWYVKDYVVKVILASVATNINLSKMRQEFIHKQLKLKKSSQAKWRMGVQTKLRQDFYKNSYFIIIIENLFCEFA